MKLIYILFITLSLSGLVKSEEITERINVKARMYFLFDNKQETYKHLAEFKMYEGYMSEVNSTTLRTLPGGYWFTELRLNKNSVFTYTFWQHETGDIEKRYEKPRKNLTEFSVDVSTPNVHSIKLHESDEGILMLDIIPEEPEKVLSPVTLSEQIYGLTNMCFKNSAIVIDDSFYLGSVDGFAEVLKLRIPELINIELSLKPLENMKPIGYLENGIVQINLPDGQMLQVIGVGIGFAGLRDGGRFKVYGLFDEPTISLAQAKKSNKYLLEREYKGNRLKALLKASSAHPYNGVIGITISTGKLSPQLKQLIGHGFLTKACG